jgi:hypothetical protein
MSRRASGRGGLSLVHEAYLGLLGDRAEASSRGHFFAAAAEATRRILDESAHRRRRRKRGDDLARLPLNETELLATKPREDVLALDKALTELAGTDRAAASRYRASPGVPVRHQRPPRPAERQPVPLGPARTSRPRQPSETGEAKHPHQHGINGLASGPQ